MVIQTPRMVPLMWLFIVGILAFIVGWFIPMAIRSSQAHVTYTIRGTLEEAQLFCDKETQDCKWIWAIRVNNAEASEESFYTPKREDLVSANIADSRANLFVDPNSKACIDSNTKQICDYTITKPTVSIVAKIILNEESLPEFQGVPQ